MKLRSVTTISVMIVVVLFLGMAVSVTVMIMEEASAREFDGDVKLFEKVKPENTPGKPNKPGDDGDDSSAPDLSTYNKLAVVIGISDYRGRSNDLRYCDDDARDMYNYLRSRNYPAGNIRLLIDKQATARNIIKAIDWMDQYQKQDTECVFFYSGHGSTYNGGIDAYDPDGVDEGIVSHDLYLILDDTLKSEFSTIDTSKFAIMFDSCHSGGMDDLSGSGRVISAPCGATEYSYDGSSTMQNGVWTYYLMTGLNSYNTVEEAHSYAAGLAPAWVSVNYGAAMNPVMYDQYSASADSYWHF